MVSIKHGSVLGKKKYSGSLIGYIMYVYTVYCILTAIAIHVPNWFVPKSFPAVPLALTLSTCAIYKLYTCEVFSDQSALSLHSSIFHCFILAVCVHVRPSALHLFTILCMEKSSNLCLSSFRNMYMPFSSLCSHNTVSVPVCWTSLVCKCSMLLACTYDFLHICYFCINHELLGALALPRSFNTSCTCTSNHRHFSMVYIHVCIRCTAPWYLIHVTAFLRAANTRTPETWGSIVPSVIVNITGCLSYGSVLVRLLQTPNKRLRLFQMYMYTKNHIEYTLITLHIHVYVLQYDYVFYKC